ncbi:MAG: hypothetical protein KAG94_00270 [Clostridiales bacterium]|nr:hypothetical protein [Clostridiales bacterium]
MIDFFDIHAHVYKYQYPNKDGRMLFINEEQLKRVHQKLHIKKAILLPIVSPEIYVPQSVGEIIDIANRSNGKYIPFCNIDPRVLTNTSDAPIGRLIEHYVNQGCKGIGEVMPNLPWNDKRMQNLLYHAEQAKLPLLFDMTGNKDFGYGIYDEPLMPQLEQCLIDYPNLLFIGHGPYFWAHIREINKEDYIDTYQTSSIHKEGRISYLLRQYSNLHVDLSANSGYNAISRDYAFTQSFLHEFQNKIYYGTDICYEGQTFKTANLLVTMANENKISKIVLQKIAQNNFLKLIG